MRVRLWWSGHGRHVKAERDGQRESRPERQRQRQRQRGSQSPRSDSPGARAVSEVAGRGLGEVSMLSQSLSRRWELPPYRQKMRGAVTRWNSKLSTGSVAGGLSVRATESFTHLQKCRAMDDGALCSNSIGQTRQAWWFPPMWYAGGVGGVGCAKLVVNRNTFWHRRPWEARFTDPTARLLLRYTPKVQRQTETLTSLAFLCTGALVQVFLTTCTSWPWFGANRSLLMSWFACLLTVAFVVTPPIVSRRRQHPT